MPGNKHKIATFSPKTVSLIGPTELPVKRGRLVEGAARKTVDIARNNKKYYIFIRLTQNIKICHSIGTIGGLRPSPPMPPLVPVQNSLSDYCKNIK